MSPMRELDQAFIELGSDSETKEILYAIALCLKEIAFRLKDSNEALEAIQNNLPATV